MNLTFLDHYMQICTQICNTKSVSAWDALNWIQREIFPPKQDLKVCKLSEMVKNFIPGFICIYSLLIWIAYQVHCTGIR